VLGWRTLDASVRHLLVIFLLIGICGCNRPPPPQPFRLRVAAIGALLPLEPKLQSGYGKLLKAFVFQPLLEPTSTGEWRSPCLEEWTQLGPGHYRLRVKDSVRFSDGSRVQTEDLLSSLKAFGLQGTLGEAGVEIRSLDPTILTEYLLLEAVLFKQGAGQPLGTGPFEVAQQSEQSVLLRRVRPVAGRIQEVELVSFSTPRDAFAGALRGEVNSLVMPDHGELELLHGVPALTIARAKGMHAVTAILNTRRLPPEERKRLLATLPVAELARAYGTDCPPEPQAPTDRTPLPPGRPLDLLVAQMNPGMVRTALALRRALGERAGELQLHSPLQAEREATEGGYDLLVASSLVSPPGVAALLWHTGLLRDWARYANPVLDRSLRAGDFPGAIRSLESDPPALFICRPERVAALDSRVKNPRLGPFDLLESLPEWEVTP
jgi:hypothetical protein